MNLNNKYKNSFFFLVDSLKESETKNYKIDNFFQDTSFLFPNKFFSIFNNTKIDFDFLEKNQNLISFFFVFNKIFFKDQIKNLKICFINENKFININNEKKLKLSFFLNLYFFSRYVLHFIFLLKKFSFTK